MSESTLSATDGVERLMEALRFTDCDEETTMGELLGVPATCTVLGGDPLALLFQFRIHPDNSDPPAITELLAHIPKDEVSCSVEEKFLWLSLYRLDETHVDELVQLVSTIAERIQASSYQVLTGCLKCGTESSVQNVYVDGHPSRACKSCLAEAADEQRVLSEELNRPSVLATIGLPLTAALMAFGWAILWTFIDLTLERWQIQVIEINVFTILLIIGLELGLGWILGWHAGKFMRRSAAIQRSPKIKIGWFLLVTCVCGEILYLAIGIARILGVFDLTLASKFFGDLVSSYTGFWILCKLGLIGSLYLFCYSSAIVRKEVEIDL